MRGWTAEALTQQRVGAGRGRPHPECCGGGACGWGWEAGPWNGDPEKGPSCEGLRHRVQRDGGLRDGIQTWGG